MSSQRIVVVGAGPTGLGAAWRLRELTYPDWVIYEQQTHVGGHASSLVDPHGFTWDQGGHVLFSHYPYFDRLIDELLGADTFEHMRESWIRIQDRWVPYPFQNNIRYLPPEAIFECLTGLMSLNGKSQALPQNFHEWILQTFGAGIGQHFMFPYNQKVWSYDLSQMSYQWIGDRVSVIDLKRVLKNVILGQDDVSWGPNRTFKFPKRGATGEIYRRMLPAVKGHLHFSKKLTHLDLKAHTVSFSDGSQDRYDVLIYTGALDRLIQISKPVPAEVDQAARGLVHNSLAIVGIGLGRPNPTSRCWLYFPEKNAPFYRVTHFSTYSPFNVPQGDVERFSSLMCEVSFPSIDFPSGQPSQETILQEVLTGLLATGLLEESDLPKVISRHIQFVEYGYPIPTLDRDKVLAKIQPFLESHQVYSRGRFGAWLYEIGNMDHSVMQGVEVVDRILSKSPETVWKPAGSP